MNKHKQNTDQMWEMFQKQAELTDAQVDQFKRYEGLLSTRNEEFNLTAITDLIAIMRLHFHDSLTLRDFVDLTQIKTIADIGTGAGFPSIPLKIVFPHLKLILIEVTHKKQVFLDELVNLLGLDDVEIFRLDWRTFLRTTQYDVDLFVTRAALGERELIRAFKPASHYRNASIVYWAALNWECDPLAQDFVRDQKEYKIAYKKRKLVFFGLPS